MTNVRVKAIYGFFACIVLICFVINTATAGDNEFKIKETKWDREKQRLLVKGVGQRGNKVVVTGTGSTTQLGSTSIREEEWKIRVRNLSSVPCNVTATQSDGRTYAKSVKNAPRNCSNGETTPPVEPPVDPVEPPVDPVEPPVDPVEPPVEPVLPPLSGDFTILAANDLGMHCADQDYRIFSILPPYNVLNAQVLRKGGEPRLMSPADGVNVTYKAAVANIIDPNDPDFERSLIATDSINSTSLNSDVVFKQNFWEQGIDPNSTDPARDTLALGWLAYEELYPSLYGGVLRLFPDEPDLGLPAPDLVQLYYGPDGQPNTGDEALEAHQAKMPGLANTPQATHGYVEDLPFFIDFPFGYRVSNFNRHTLEGIPITTVDDQGRNNAYPLFLVEAKDQSGNVLAAVNTVVPVASEADCQLCHASQNVCDHVTSNTLVCDDIANDNYDSNLFVNDASGIVGDTPEQQVINAAKTNILRLHDLKNGTALAGTADDGMNTDGTAPGVVCANCHYSPALDLAHLGPTDDNGKEQTQHISMSRAMHGVHGKLSQNPDYEHLFPIMPPPSDGQGNLRDPILAEETLMETCYNCHPGKQNKCLRGAMGGSGTVCQDCHGQLTQVGDDFTENFPIVNFPAEGSADLSKRVSWASEPQCQACHVGDVNQVAQLKKAGELDDTLVNLEDSLGNPDGLRLQMTYRLSDHKSEGGPDNLPLLDFPDSRFATTESLYRLSGADNGSGKGHGGLSCEGCHGSTHAIWPNKNPFANDNKTSTDLQGHVGTIIECSTCHTGEMDNNLDGPHGLHPVGNTKFVENHGGLAERNPQACFACHGENGEGSVLARTATARSGLKTDFEDNEGPGRKNYEPGTPVTCTDCHKTALQ